MPNYILTGTPGAGKTAILRLLELHGHAVVEEAATDVIAVEHAVGNNESRDVPAFLDKIVTLQRRRQAGAPASRAATVFYDRSPVCTLALSHYCGVAPPRVLTDEVDRIIAQHVYEPIVFFVRNQGFVQPTAARRISFEHSLVFERIHEEVYRDLGFQLVEVPAGPPLDRVALIRGTVERLTGQAELVAAGTGRPAAGCRDTRRATGLL